MVWGSFLLDKNVEIVYIYTIWGISVYPIPLESLPGRKTRIFFILNLLLLNKPFCCFEKNIPKLSLFHTLFP